ncbi:MAG: ASCH domain-containing protein [Candidatus Magasanikiibacteriota bacterium]
MFLESWRSKHKDFFAKEYPNQFNENSLVVCEEFKVVKVL